MKVCYKCKLEKHNSKFSKDKSTKDGLHYYCKCCEKLRINPYYKTKMGLFSRIYGNQKRSSKERGHNPPTYTKQELIDWILSQPNFEELWNNWVKSDYLKNLIPSVDRLDDYKGYSLDRIQLITWKENREKAHLDVKEGRKTKDCKPVIGTYIKTGEVIEFYSISQAGRELGISHQNISLCCLKKPIKIGFNKNGEIRYYNPKSSGGCTWEFKN